MEYRETQLAGLAGNRIEQLIVGPATCCELHTDHSLTVPTFDLRDRMICEVGIYDTIAEDLSQFL